eukprot:CAMPEP_0170638748 /NCGR_PEP_ID=MMETSP0224-20130122/39246_1 /TAXON_ID=285029 /ORGANISM="Togula jolla, Strain CCCM 725" /LENGTH=80 /DNA_ID=CAMNT_0010968987 /DNA_START=160 /DNA_END=399 /DNA_ORIENTATION=-
MKPFVGSKQLANAVAQPTTLSTPFSLSTSFGRNTPGSTAARTMAASTAFGMGARIEATLGMARRKVVRPATRPMIGDAAP